MKHSYLPQQSLSRKVWLNTNLAEQERETLFRVVSRLQKRMF